MHMIIVRYNGQRNFLVCTFNDVSHICTKNKNENADYFVINGRFLWLN